MYELMFVESAGLCKRLLTNFTRVSFLPRMYELMLVEIGNCLNCFLQNSQDLRCLFCMDQHMCLEMSGLCKLFLTYVTYNWFAFSLVYINNNLYVHDDVLYVS